MVSKLFYLKLAFKGKGT